jgi:hypothetical protein
VVREEAMIVRRQTTDDVSATGSAVSGVFDGVGLDLVSGGTNNDYLMGATGRRAMENGENLPR